MSKPIEHGLLRDAVIASLQARPGQKVAALQARIQRKFHGLRAPLSRISDLIGAMRERGAVVYDDDLDGWRLAHASATTSAPNPRGRRGAGGAGAR